MLVKDVWKEMKSRLVENGYWKNWVHGGLHINEVKKVLNEI